VPEQRAEVVSVWAFLAAAPLSLVTDVLQQNMESEVGAGAVMVLAVPLDGRQGVAAKTDLID
jgi:hypothetical protein